MDQKEYQTNDFEPNPYEGTEVGEAWQRGYVDGLENPDSDPTPPLVLPPDSLQVYQEGVLAAKTHLKDAQSPPTTSDPYAGTDKDPAYQQGFRDGLEQPGTDLTPPSPYTLEEQQAYMDGVKAANSPPSINPETGESGGVPQGYKVGGHLAEITGEAAYKTWEHGTETMENLGVHATDITDKLNKVWKYGSEEVGPALAEGLIVGIIITLVTDVEFPPEGDPEMLKGQLAQVCNNIDCTDLFMPLCQSDDHGLHGDDIFEKGYWHGNVYLDFCWAYSEANAHLKQIPDSTDPDRKYQLGVVHFSASNKGVEFLNVGDLAVSTSQSE